MAYKANRVNPNRFGDAGVPNQSATAGCSCVLLTRRYFARFAIAPVLVLMKAL
jgi:hypothetical protein